MTLASMVGQASFQIAGANGPSTIERSYLRPECTAAAGAAAGRGAAASGEVSDTG